MIFYPICSIAVLFPQLNRYSLNIHHIMTGLAIPHFDARNALLVGVPPWVLFDPKLPVTKTR
jgi:hypothetical protein